MLAKVISGAVVGIDAFRVDVEVDIAMGLPAFTTVGLPETSVKESRERVKAAISNSGYAFPDDRITINLAPADVKKEGTGFDLPVAVGILAATGLISGDAISTYTIVGELSLDGNVKPVKGILPMTLAAKETGCSGILVPYDSRKEAAVVRDIQVLPVKNLYQVVDFFRGVQDIEPENHTDAIPLNAENSSDVDFSDVMGQEHVKRGLEVAAAGGHNLLMIGPPGSGKTMMAKRLPTILPPLSFDEAVETTKIYSVVGLLGNGTALISERPFRSPHHTISDAGLIGGGQVPRPGEVSLSQNGVLFLDELPEFKKHVLEVLRQPIEDKIVTISRATSTITYPANFMLAASMNPCPCGFLGDVKHACTCSKYQVQKYISKISGPLLDRIDIHMDVPAVPHRDLQQEGGSESSADIRQRVVAARQIQTQRFQTSSIYSNSQMTSRMIKRYCQTDAAVSRMLETAIERLGLSARAYNRILKVARTIADLEQETGLNTHHVAEAIQYRGLDRERHYG